MIEFFVKKPVTTIMFVLVFVVLGIFSYSNILVEKYPKVDFPIVTVTAKYPGATPLEIETLVVKKIEDAVAEVSQIKKIRSYSYESVGFISIEFLLSADANVKSAEVKDKVEAILNDLPDGVEKPLVEKYDPLLEPVMDLVLSSDTLDTRALYEYADKTLKTKFSSVAGVAKVEVYGGKKRQINVKLDPVLMKQHYITIPEVISALMMKNKNIPAGEIEKDNHALSVRFVGEFQSIDQIANFSISSTDGSSFKLKEIAKIEDSYKKLESMARFNGKEVVGLSLKKASDGNAIRISKDMAKKLKEFRAALPNGMNLDIATDTTTFILNETVGTQVSIAQGILFTVIILLLFTGRFNLTFIASVIIPTSLVSTLFPMWISGFSINFMTLLAIATALGTLISNALVIIESVLVHLDRGKDSVQAAIDGTKEVTVAIIATTGTNLVVFAPIALMGGVIGMFMRSFGLTVVYATLFSLLASFSLTPMMCALMLKKKGEEKDERKNKFLAPIFKIVDWTNKFMDFLKVEYKYIFDFIFKYPKSTLLAVTVLFFASFLILPYVDSDFDPKSDENKIKINVIMPQGSTMERTLATVAQVEQIVDKIPEKKSYLVNIGKNGLENAVISLDLIPVENRKRKDVDIINALIPLTSKIPDAEINFERGNSFEAGAGDISINIYGQDYDQLIKYSAQMKDIMLKTGFFRSVKSSYKTPKKEIVLHPSQDRLVEYGLNSAQVGSTMRASIYGDDTNVYKEKGEEYKINVELDERYASNFDDIKEISVLSRKGLVPITKLGEIKDDKALPTILHRDKVRVIQMDGFIAKSSLGYVTSVLEEKFKAMKLPQGYGYKYVGNSEEQEESNVEMGKSFLLAIILTYMLLCAIMNSFIAYPVAVMTTVATSFVGVFLALFFMGQSINVASMLGMIMLVGIVVNNAILLLDYAWMKQQEGVSVVDSLWLGASEKFRAIVMTSIAIILGVLPQLWSIMLIKTSMGAVMVGGILASIVFTFIYVPVVYYYLDRFEKKFLSRKEAK